MISESTLRIAAVVAGLAIFVPWQSLLASAKSLVSGVKRPPEQPTVDDAHTVVEIARRLRKSGNAKGADLCKQLLDVMLSSEAKS
jgi:hypothetical protein